MVISQPSNKAHFSGSHLLNYRKLRKKIYPVTKSVALELAVNFL